MVVKPAHLREGRGPARHQGARPRVPPDHLRPRLHRLASTCCASATSGKKRPLALREHALGLEALTGFVAREPLWRVHEAVFAVLALESEPVDPRL